MSRVFHTGDGKMTDLQKSKLKVILIHTIGAFIGAYALYTRFSYPELTETQLLLKMLFLM